MHKKILSAKERQMISEFLDYGNTSKNFKVLISNS